MWNSKTRKGTNIDNENETNRAAMSLMSHAMHLRVHEHDVDMLCVCVCMATEIERECVCESKRERERDRESLHTLTFPSLKTRCHSEV